MYSKRTPKASRDSLFLLEASQYKNMKQHEYFTSRNAYTSNLTSDSKRSVGMKRLMSSLNYNASNETKITSMKLQQRNQI